MKLSATSAFLAASLVMGGCATPYMKAVAAEKAQVAETESSLAGERYVAIGSSFAAGPLLPPGKPGAPVRCGQSLNNYPTLLAERFGMILTDRSCSGAKTDNVLGPWGDIPPQIDSVTPQTRLVTVTMGGNDLNYIGNLFSATCAFRARLAPPGTKLKPCNPIIVPKEEDYARVEMQLREIARRVRSQAPKARLVFVQYLTPLPAPGITCPALPVREADAATVRTIGRRLGEITDRVGRDTGALVVEMNLASVSHTPCDEVPWMIGAPEGYDGKQGLQWHLNLAGMQATADGISYWLIQEGVRPVKPSVVIDSAMFPVPAPTDEETGAPTLPLAPIEGVTGGDAATAGTAPAAPMPSAPTKTPAPQPTPKPTPTPKAR